MSYLRRLKLRDKIGLSLGLLIAIMLVNVLIGALAANTIWREIEHQKRVENIVSEIDKVRLLVSRYVNTFSRESAQQVLLQLESTRQRIDAANQHLDGPQLQQLLPRVNEFQAQFQKYIIETDKTLALESRTALLGQRMLMQLQEARNSPAAGLERQTFDTLERQILTLAWSTHSLHARQHQQPLKQIADIKASLAQLQAHGYSGNTQEDAQRVLFRILRNATDYEASLESFMRYQTLNTATEQTLNQISDAIEADCKQTNLSVGAMIQNRIDVAMGTLLLAFALLLLCAVALRRFLTGEILRPIQSLVRFTQQIGQGDLSARATVEVNDEIGDLTDAFNTMTLNLSASRHELQEKNTALEAARQGLEQRVQERTLALSEANQALAAQALLTNQIVDTAPIAIFLLDMSGRVTQANAGMVSMFGYPLEALIGMEYIALVDPRELEIRRQMMLSLLNSEIPLVDLDRRFQRSGGEQFWGHITGRVFYGTQGEKLGLVGVIADITERKKAEDDLKLAASVFTHAREGIMITDANANIIDVNDTFVSITGYTRDEVQGKNPRILKSQRQSAEYYSTMWTALKETSYWQGEVWNRRKSGELYAEMLTVSAVHNADRQVQHYVALFSDITPMKEHQAELEKIAHFDVLTQLPNRLLLADRLQQAMLQCQRRQTLLAVVYLDLDGFKAVNDIHGHVAGDELLVVLAQRMQATLRKGDTLARIGGDEFVAVLVDLQYPDDCRPMLSRLLQAACAPVALTILPAPVTLAVSASIGVTLYPQDDSDADLLMRHADQAMYSAKRSGKNRFHLFDAAD